MSGEPHRIFIDPDFVADCRGVTGDVVHVNDWLLDALRTSPRDEAKALLVRVIYAAEAAGARGMTDNERRVWEAVEIAAADEAGLTASQHSPGANKKKVQRARKVAGLGRRAAGAPKKK